MSARKLFDRNRAAFPKTGVFQIGGNGAGIQLLLGANGDRLGGHSTPF